MQKIYVVQDDESKKYLVISDDESEAKSIAYASKPQNKVPVKTPGSPPIYSNDDSSNYKAREFEDDKDGKIGRRASPGDVEITIDGTIYHVSNKIAVQIK